MEVMSYDSNVYVEFSAGLPLLTNEISSLSMCSYDFVFRHYDIYRDI